MRADVQFFLHPTHRLWWVSLHQGPQILVLDYSRSTTSGLIFETGTKFHKPTSSSAFINTIIAKCLVNFSGCFGRALVQFEFVAKNCPKIAQRYYVVLSWKEAKNCNLEKMNSTNVQSTKISIDQYILRHSRINIYWDMGIQRHMTLKRTKLLKQRNRCIFFWTSSADLTNQFNTNHQI